MGAEEVCNVVAVVEALCDAGGTPLVGWSNHQGDGVEASREMSVGGAHGERGPSSPNHLEWAL